MILFDCLCEIVDCEVDVLFCCELFEIDVYGVIGCFCIEFDCG